jgi:phosphatidylglycerophosphatase A
LSETPVAAPRRIDLRTRIALTIATFFGVGFLPVAPGTYGTAAAIPLAWWMSHYSTPWQLFTATVVTLVGIWAAALTGRYLGVVDASQIVVDEVAGLLVTMIGVPFTWQTALAGFLLFRLFDITKPWPAWYFDRKVKNGAGVVLDDIAAGIYSRGCLALLALVAPSWFVTH